MTLTQLFTAIANAIRAKTGSTDTIIASNFPEEIADITTGHLDNAEYEEANDDLDDILEGTTPTIIYPPDWSELGYTDTPDSIIDAFNYSKTIYNEWDSSVTSLNSKFNNNTNLIYMPLVDTSNATTMTSCFTNCNTLQYVPLLNLSNVTNMAMAFQGCYNLESIPQFDTSKVFNFSNLCNSCSKLKNVPVLDTGEIKYFTNAFSGCQDLTNDSLNNIMQMCINAIQYTGTKNLNVLGLSSTQKTTCQGLSNYQAFLNAGWTA